MYDTNTDPRQTNTRRDKPWTLLIEDLTHPRFNKHWLYLIIVLSRVCRVWRLSQINPKNRLNKSKKICQVNFVLAYQSFYNSMWEKDLIST